MFMLVNGKKMLEELSKEDVLIGDVSDIDDEKSEEEAHLEVIDEEESKEFCQAIKKSGINYAELSRLLNIDRDTLGKYMKIAIDGGLITIIKGGISITDPNIYEYYIDADYDTEYYTMICGWCLHYKITPPERNDYLMGLLIARYPILPRDIIMLAKKDKKEPKEYIKVMKANTDKYHILKSFLPYQLTTKKVQPKEGYLSWEYLCKVLNITIKDKPQKHELTM